MIKSDLIRDASEEIYRRAICDVGGNKDLALEKALKGALKREENPARQVTQIMLNAIKSSNEKGIYICGDTGIPLYIVRVGSEVRAPKDIAEAVEEGVANTIEKLGLRHQCTTKLVEAITLKEHHNRPVIHYDFLPGKDYIEIAVVPKGTGSTPYSAADVLSWEPRMVKKFVVDSVWKAGPRACPPYFVGVGIGGALDTAAMLATDALIRPIGEKNPIPEVAKLEEELLEAVNMLGIGPMGVGGKTTAFAVNVEVAPCCAALERPATNGHGFGWIPASVLVNCWPSRYGKARIYEDGLVEYL